MDKNSSKILISTLALLLLVSFSNGVNAETASINDLPAIPALGQEQIKAENITPLIKSASSLQKIINQGSSLITERLNTLAKQKKKVQKSKLTTDQKNQLNASINQNVSALTALRLSIKADVATSTAKADVQKIYTDYRIYAVFIPQNNLIINLDIQQNHLSDLNNYFRKAQARINSAQAKGKDVTTRQKALDAAKAMVPDIQNKLTDSMNKVLTLKPADYPNASKSLIAETNKAVKDIRQAFINLNKTVKLAK